MDNTPLPSHRHHAVGKVEGLFNAITMMNVNVYVQHSRVHLSTSKGLKKAVGGVEHFLFVGPRNAP